MTGDLVPVLIYDCAHCGGTHEARVPTAVALDVDAMRDAARVICPTARKRDAR